MQTFVWLFLLLTFLFFSTLEQLPVCFVFERFKWLYGCFNRPVSIDWWSTSFVFFHWCLHLNELLCVQLQLNAGTRSAAAKLSLRSRSVLPKPVSSYRFNLQHRECVLIGEGSVRWAVRPLWSPRLLVFFVPQQPGDTVTASGRKKLSVVEAAGDTCLTCPSRGPWRIERQLVDLTGNAMVTVSTAVLMATQAKRPATRGNIKS